MRFRQLGRADLEESLVPGHFGMPGLPALADGTCVHLGAPTGARDCSIYELRPESCRLLEPGSAQCLSYRRAAFGA